MDDLTKTSAIGTGINPVASLGLHYEQFLHFVEVRVRDRQTAEDILQSAYARAITQAGSLRNEGSADAWFYRILRNAVIDFYRYRSIEDRVLTALEDDMDVAAPIIENEPNICQCIQRSIDELKPAYAEVLRDVELSEAADSLDAFAQRNGITSGNAAVRAYRARKALEKSLRHTCGSCAGAGCLDCTCGT